MASNDAGSAPRKHSFFRFYLPWLIAVLGILAVTALWAWPDPEFERVKRVSGTMILMMLVPFLLAVWFLVFAPDLRWWVRLAALATLGLGFWVSWRAVVRQVHFTGDLVPIVDFRW